MPLIVTCSFQESWKCTQNGFMYIHVVDVYSKKAELHFMMTYMYVYVRTCSMHNYGINGNYRIPLAMERHTSLLHLWNWSYVKS